MNHCCIGFRIGYTDSLTHLADMDFQHHTDYLNNHCHMGIVRKQVVPENSIG